MAADITETRPALYHALLADGWDYRPLQGGGGVFRRLAGTERLAVQVKRGGACELWRNERTAVGRFSGAAPDQVVAAAAIAQRKELAPNQETR